MSARTRVARLLSHFETDVIPVSSSTAPNVASHVLCRLALRLYRPDIYTRGIYYTLELRERVPLLTTSLLVHIGLV